MDPKTVGPFFWYTYDYGFTGAPLINLHGSTREVDPPYRYGRAVIVRLPFSTGALVLGKWDGQLEDEDSAILTATGGRLVGVSTEEIREWD